MGLPKVLFGDDGKDPPPWKEETSDSHNQYTVWMSSDEIRGYRRFLMDAEILLFL